MTPGTAVTSTAVLCRTPKKETGWSEMQADVRRKIKNPGAVVLILV